LGFFCVGIGRSLIRVLHFTFYAEPQEAFGSVEFTGPRSRTLYSLPVSRRFANASLVLDTVQASGQGKIMRRRHGWLGVKRRSTVLELSGISLVSS
jgi:hypothetical protein